MRTREPRLIALSGGIENVPIAWFPSGSAMVAS
jgi:hypothetical protein